VPELADQIERAGDENRIIGSGFGKGLVKRLFRRGNDCKAGSMMGGNFGESRRGDGAGSTRLRKNDFRSVRE
jgi:hypothetical protein